MIRCFAVIACAVIFLMFDRLAAAEQSGAQFDSIIITGLDVSSSIDAQETALQVNGMAAAIRSPEVVSAIQMGKFGRVLVLVFVWADGAYPELLPWSPIGTQAEADAAAAKINARLLNLSPEAARVGSLTDLSGALTHAAGLVAAAPFQAERVLVNIIGNGADNVRDGPTAARAALLATGATINGVVVGGDADVKTYYRSSVIGGQGSFVRTADGPEDITGALVSKFITEIAALSR